MSAITGRIREQLDIAFDNRAALHTWIRLVNELTNELADAVEAGGKDLRKRLRKTPVVTGGYWGAPGRGLAAKIVTSPILRAVEELRSVPPLVGQGFYKFDGLYVPVESMRSTAGAVDTSR